MSAKESEINSSAESTWKRRARRVCSLKPHLFIIFFVSIAGFAYHFSLSLKNYLDYKTTVSFSQEMPENYQYTYPAVTVCLKNVIPHFLMEEEFPEYKKAVEQIREESLKRNDPDFWIKQESSKFNDQKYSGKNLFLYFEHELTKNLTILEILDKFSFGKEKDCYLDAKPLVRGGHKMHNCENVREPIESINGLFRCFTYLSQLDLEVENENLFRTTVFLQNLNFEQRTNKLLFVIHERNGSRSAHPFDQQFRARAMVHSANELPVPNFYYSVTLYEWSRIYDLVFWKTVSHNLEKPYETNCFKYKTGPNETNQSFDDCVNKCMIGHYRERCKCLPREGLLYRRSYLLPDDRFCPKVASTPCRYTNYRVQCEGTCQKDCLQEKYFFAQDVNVPYLNNVNLSGLQIRRKPVLDQVYRHSPSVTLVQLISDFGGLGGLWLGYSVITITTALIQMISKPLEKRFISE